MSTRKLRGLKVKAVNNLFLMGWSVTRLARLFRTNKARIEQALRLSVSVLTLVAGLSLVLEHGGVQGQGITIPNSFTANTTADPDQVNANFAALANDALNRTGGTMTGTFNSLDVKPTTDNARDLGSSSLQYRDLYLGNSLLLSGATAPALSASGKGRIYFDSTLNAFLASENGAAYASLGVLKLLANNSGTDTTATATNVASKAITGLTQKDSLLVVVDSNSVTQATATLNLYSATDSVSIASVDGGSAIAAGNFQKSVTWISCHEQNATTVSAISMLFNDATSATNGIVRWQSPTLATNWTGNWTLALRQGGVTAGGTFHFSWKVYRIFGQ